MVLLDSDDSWNGSPLLISPFTCFVSAWSRSGAERRQVGLGLSARHFWM